MHFENHYWDMGRSPLAAAGERHRRREPGVRGEAAAFFAAESLVDHLEGGAVQY